MNVSAQESVYISDPDNIYIDNDLALTMAGGATVATDTLVFDDTLYARGGTFTGYYKLKRLSVDGGSTVTLDSAGTDVTEIMITGGVHVTGSSTLDAKGQLRLLSKATVTGKDSTGRIEELTSGNSVTGTVTIERYIPGGKRRYRFFSHPFTTTQTLSASLMDDIDVTGSGGSTNGFTTTQTNNPSCWWFDATLGDTATSGPNPGWQAFTSANATNWGRHQGLYLLVRGAKGEGLNGQAYTPSPVTIDMTGPVNQGSQTINLFTGVNGGAFNIVGNPYPSAVNLKTPVNNMSNKKGSGFWLMNSNMGSVGAYEVYLYNTDAMLPSNSAFAIDVTANTSITFQESYKTDTGRAVFKGTAVQDIVEFQVHSGSIYWDKMYVVFDPAADADFDNADARKFTNADANLYAVTDDGVQVSINGLPFSNNKVVPVNFDTKIADNYEIRVTEYTLQPAYQLYLIDKYMNTSTLLKPGSTYRFAVTSDTLSAGARFQLGFTDLAVPEVSKGGLKIYPNPVHDILTVEFEEPISKETAMLDIIDNTGRKVMSQKLDSGVSRVDLSVSELAAGVYHVQISGSSNIAFSKFIKIAE